MFVRKREGWQKDASECEELARFLGCLTFWVMGILLLCQVKFLPFKTVPVSIVFLNSKIIEKTRILRESITKDDCNSAVWLLSAVVTKFFSRCLLGLLWRTPDAQVFLMLESNVRGGLLAPGCRWAEVSGCSGEGHSQAWMCAQSQGLCPFKVSVTGLVKSLWQVRHTNDCRRFSCCPALNLVLLVFLNNVGKKVKYKQSLVLCCCVLFWLRPVLLQAAPRSHPGLCLA